MESETNRKIRETLEKFGVASRDNEVRDGLNLIGSLSRICCMKIQQIKIKKRLIEDILQDFQEETHTIFRDQKNARMLIEYAIAKFIIEINKG